MNQKNKRTDKYMCMPTSDYVQNKFCILYSKDTNNFFPINQKNLYKKRKAQVRSKFMKLNIITTSSAPPDWHYQQ